MPVDEAYLAGHNIPMFGTICHLLIQLNSREKGRHFKKKKKTPNQTLQTHQTHHMGKGLAWVQDVVPLPIPMQTHGPNPMGIKTPAIH